MSISQSGKVSEKWYPAIVQFQTRVDIGGKISGLCNLYEDTLKRKASKKFLFMFQYYCIIEVKYMACLSLMVRDAVIVVGIWRDENIRLFGKEILML